MAAQDRAMLGLDASAVCSCPSLEFGNDLLVSVMYN
jgi:hypothetical protein